MQGINEKAQQAPESSPHPVETTMDNFDDSQLSGQQLLERSRAADTHYDTLAAQYREEEAFLETLKSELLASEVQKQKLQSLIENLPKDTRDDFFAAESAQTDVEEPSSIPTYTDASSQTEHDSDNDPHSAASAASVDDETSLPVYELKSTEQSPVDEWYELAYEILNTGPEQTYDATWPQFRPLSEAIMEFVQIPATKEEDEHHWVREDDSMQSMDVCFGIQEHDPDEKQAPEATDALFSSQDSDVDYAKAKALSSKPRIPKAQHVAAAIARQGKGEGGEGREREGE